MRLQKHIPGLFEVVVVDNDANRSAEVIVDTFRRHNPNIPTHYSVEPVRNISLARNRSLRQAISEWIAFIDDDEMATPLWLNKLYSAVQDYHADGALGPVLPIHPPDTPTWIRKGRFFMRPRLSSGDPIARNGGRTSNAIIKSSILRNSDIAFDPNYGLSGGEDLVLFNTLINSGVRLVWCDEAVVYERVIPERTNFSWLLRRGFAGGQNYARSTATADGKVASFKMFVQGFVAVLAFPVIAVIVLPLGKHYCVHWLRKGAIGLGKILALTSYRYKQYRT